MGDYTEFKLTAKLKRTSPVIVLATLREMLNPTEGGAQFQLPDHPLFQKFRWRYMLRCASAYFETPGPSAVTFNKEENQYTLTVHCSLKNYEKEIESFMDWIMLYIDAPLGTRLGHKHFEFNEDPSPIHKTNPEV